MSGGSLVAALMGALRLKRAASEGLPPPASPRDVARRIRAGGQSIPDRRFADDAQADEAVDPRWSEAPWLDPTGADPQAIEDRLFAMGDAHRAQAPKQSLAPGAVGASAPDRFPPDLWSPGGQLPMARLPVRVHVEHILTCLHNSQFQPGEAIGPATMRAIYAHICVELGWRPHKWNTLAKELKFAMGRGPRGAAKTYIKVLQPDGTEKPVRAYFVPPRPSSLRDGLAGAPAPARTPIDPQSIPRAMRHAA
jgi:hypothetical protein